MCKLAIWIWWLGFQANGYAPHDSLKRVEKSSLTNHRKQLNVQDDFENSASRLAKANPLQTQKPLNLMKACAVLMLAMNPEAGFNPSMPLPVVGCLGDSCQHRNKVAPAASPDTGRLAVMGSSTIARASKRQGRPDMLADQTPSDTAKVVVTDGSDSFASSRLVFQFLHDVGNYSKIVAFSSSADDAKKHVLSQKARYSGLINVLEFAEGGDAEFAASLQAADAWILVNSKEDAVLEQIQAASNAGVKRAFVHFVAAEFSPAQSAALTSALGSSGMDYTLMRTGSLSKKTLGDFGLVLSELDVQTCDEIDGDDAFRFMIQALTLDEAEGRVFSLQGAPVGTKLLELRQQSNSSRRLEVEALLRGEIQTAEDIQEAVDERLAKMNSTELEEEKPRKSWIEQRMENSSISDGRAEEVLDRYVNATDDYFRSKGVREKNLPGGSIFLKDFSKMNESERGGYTDKEEFLAALPEDFRAKYLEAREKMAKEDAVREKEAKVKQEENDKKSAVYEKKNKVQQGRFEKYTKYEAKKNKGKDNKGGSGSGSGSGGDNKGGGGPSGPGGLKVNRPNRR